MFLSSLAQTVFTGEVWCLLLAPEGKLRPLAFEAFRMPQQACPSYNPDLRRGLYVMIEDPDRLEGWFMLGIERSAAMVVMVPGYDAKQLIAPLTLARSQG